MKCEVCAASEQFSLITAELRYGSGRSVFRCPECGLGFLHPKMSPEEERRFYEEEYGVILSNEKGCTPEELYQKQLPDAAMYLEWSRPYLSPAARCLEIGCASGYFLDTLRAEVGSVAGLESHLQLKSYCQQRGIEMLDSLEECEPASIDIVFLFFVFEHIGEPRAFLQAIRRVLSPQGKIVLVVPNINDALYARYEIPAFINFYFTPAHHFYYSPKTLDQICTSLGFRADIRTYQRYDLSNHLRWMQGGRPGGQGFYNEVFSDELNYRYREDLVAADHGDTIFAVLTDIKAHSEQDPR